jgi:hypothetical protein
VSAVLFAFLVAFVVLAEIEAVTRLMLVGGFLLLVLIGVSGGLLGLYCDAVVSNPNTAGALQQSYTALPKQAAFILSITGAIAGTGAGPLAPVFAAIGALAVVLEWDGNQNLPYYVRIAHVSTYLFSFFLAYLLGRTVRHVLDDARAGALARILWGLAIGFLVIAVMHEAVYHVIEPAQKSYVCVFG